MPYIITAALFRMLDAIQQFDIIYAMTQGGPGDRLMVFQVQAYLDFFQSTNVGRSAALLIILWAITFFLSNLFIKNWLRLRERVHGARMSMRKTNPIARTLRAAALPLVGLFFLFPIFWVLLMSFQTNEDILRIPPSLFFSPTLANYIAIITGKLVTAAGTLEIPFMRNLRNSVILSTASVAVSLLLGVPAAYAFARYKFRLGEDIAFTLLSFRFAPALLVLLPLALYFQNLGLNNSYLGLIWVYQLISLPLILWIVRGYFEDMSPDIEHAYRIDGHSWFATFLKIAMPLARPGIAAAACWPSSSAGTTSSSR